MPDEFSLAELESILSRKAYVEPLRWPTRPANLTPEQTADWDYYMSPEAIALYQKFPVSPEVRALRGIAKLSPADEHKSYDELRWEAMQEKYEKYDL